MTREQIERAAIEYAHEYYKSGKFGILNTAATAFIAGAESRQAEIDKLKADKKRTYTCARTTARVSIRQ